MLKNFGQLIFLNYSRTLINLFLIVNIIKSQRIQYGKIDFVQILSQRNYKKINKNSKSQDHLLIKSIKVKLNIILDGKKNKKNIDEFNLIFILFFLCIC